MMVESKNPKLLADWMKGTKEATNGVLAANHIDVDARVQGGMMQVCEFAGNEFDPIGKRRCKFYDKSSQRTCCMWFDQTIMGDPDHTKGHCGKGDAK